MIATVIRHYVYEVGISVFFENIISNFTTTIKPNKYLGKWWTALDKEDSTVVCWGLCIQAEDHMIVLDDGEGEYICHLDLFRLVEATEGECDLLSADDDMTDEELIKALNEENRIYWQE